MKDVSNKANTHRTARAQATVLASPATIAAVKEGRVPKGDPLPVAKIAGIQAAKNTSLIIPYCHPLPVDFVGVEFVIGDNSIVITTEVKATYKTGVEMEALSAASVAALTLYDMLKPIDDELEIIKVSLLSKKGGKSDFKERFPRQLTAAVLVMSDSISAGKKVDESGKIIKERLEQEGLKIIDYAIIPDEIKQIETTLKRYADEQNIDLVVTTGGTGLSPRDCTPEAMAFVIERDVPGIVETTRSYGQNRIPYSMLSRGRAGVRGNTLIINLPGSRGGVTDSLDAIFPAVLHTFNMMRAGRHDNDAARTK